MRLDSWLEGGGVAAENQLYYILLETGWLSDTLYVRDFREDVCGTSYDLFV
jgi:hypothetical protein